MISWTLGQRMRLLRSTLSVGSRSTSRNFSPADSCASSTRASSNQSNHIPPHPPAHTSTETPSASILVMTFEHSGHSIHGPRPHPVVARYPSLSPSRSFLRPAPFPHYGFQLEVPSYPSSLAEGRKLVDRWALGSHSYIRRREP